MDENELESIRLHAKQYSIMRMVSVLLSIVVVICAIVIAVDFVNLKDEYRAQQREIAALLTDLQSVMANTDELRSSITSAINRQGEINKALNELNEMYAAEQERYKSLREEYAAALDRLNDMNVTQSSVSTEEGLTYDKLLEIRTNINAKTSARYAAYNKAQALLKGY